MSNRAPVLLVAASLLTILIGSVPVSAQIGWLHPDFKRGVMLEIFKPSLSHGSNTTFTSAVWMVTGDFQIARSTAIVAEVSLSHVEFSSGFDYYEYYGYYPRPNQTTAGNPYFGIEFRGERSSWFGRLGFRLPVASEENDYAESFGAYTQFGRFEAFAPQVTTVSGMIGYRLKFDQDPITVRWFVEPSFMTPKQGDAEFYTNISGEFGFHTDALVGAAGIMGRVLWTESDLDFGQRSAFQFGSSLAFKIGRAELGAHLHLPLDKDWQELIDVTYGLNLTVHYE